MAYMLLRRAVSWLAAAMAAVVAASTELGRGSSELVVGNRGAGRVWGTGMGNGAELVIEIGAGSPYL